MFEDPTKKVEFVKIPEALILAEKLLSEYQINIEDFKDLYGEANIINDLKKVAKLEEKFSQERREIHDDVNKKLATIFEAILLEQGELSNWMGENSYLIRTSKFDDFINGVDLIVEWNLTSGISRMACGIDVTFNHNVQSKVDKIIREIKEGKLGTVKYFKSEVENIRGEITDIPRLIIGADVDTVRELTNLFADKDRRLASHPVQFQFFDELIIQCNYFVGIAEKYNKSEIAKKYMNLKDILETQKRLKQQSIGTDKGTRDGFMTDFLRYLQNEPI